MNVQQQNLGERQRIQDTKTDLRNQQEMFNKALIQQQFQNQMAKAGASANMLQNQAQMQQQAAQARSAGKQAMFGGLLQAGASLGAAALMPAATTNIFAGGALAGTAAGGGSDKNMKENIQLADDKKINSELKKLLSKIEPYMYDYKNPEQ